MAETTLENGMYMIEQPDPYLHLKCKWADKSWLWFHMHNDGFCDMGFCIMFMCSWLYGIRFRHGQSGVWWESRMVANTRVIEFYDGKNIGRKKPFLILYLYQDGACRLEVK